MKLSITIKEWYGQKNGLYTTQQNWRSSKKEYYITSIHYNNKEITITFSGDEEIKYSLKDIMEFNVTH